MIPEIKIPEYSPGDEFWMLINDKPINASVASVITEWTQNQFIIRYIVYFNRADIKSTVNGMPEKISMTIIENNGRRMFRTKDELISAI